jgi:hypothetical protein
LYRYAEASERQLDRVEAMVAADASTPKLSTGAGGMALPAVTLDMLVGKYL